MTNLTMPPISDDGIRVPTLNKYGWMLTRMVEPAEEFIKVASQSSKWALDMGCAYGFYTTEAIKAGARVMANDLDRGHLEILSGQIAAELRDRLQTLPGSFLDVEIAPSSLCAALSLRVLHFFPPAELEQSARKLFAILEPGGKAFIRTMTPYTRMSQTFVPEFQRRQAAGERWPGFVEDVRDWTTCPEELSAVDEQPFHYLEPQVLGRTFAEAGFELERCEYAAVNLERVHLDGRETTILVGRKPD